MEDNIITFKNISKIFPNNTGIKELNFSIKKGSFHALIGANGAGKTTMIRTLLRIYKKYDGEIFINGIKTTDFNAFKGVSYISELPIFPNEFSGNEYLMWVGRLAGLNDDRMKIKINNLAKSFGMTGVLKTCPNRLSSGQKQKLMLMKILIEEADIIIMDEPTANLDPSARIIFFDAIEKMNKEGKTVFVCSHNLDEIDAKATWVTVLKNGEIMYDGEKKRRLLIEIFKEYGHKGLDNNDKI